VDGADDASSLASMLNEGARVSVASRCGGVWIVHKLVVCTVHVHIVTGVVDMRARCCGRYSGHGFEPVAALLENAAKAVGLKDFRVRPLRRSASSAGATTVLRFDAHPWAMREGKASSTGGSVAGQTPRKGVSLHTLMTLGVVDSMKADLFRLYSYLPTLPSSDEALAPWNVRLHHDASQAKLGLPQVWLAITVTVDGLPVTIRSSDRVTAAAKDATGDNIQPGPSPGAVDARWSLLHRELSPEDTSSGGGAGLFSFIEFNSGAGVLSINLAQAFPKVGRCPCGWLVGWRVGWLLGSLS